MSLDKYRQAWKAEASRMQVTFDVELLSKEVQNSHQSFRSMIFWRDVREVGTALVMLPMWFAMGIGKSLPWTWYLTVPALIWVAGFLLVDRKRHPQQSSEPGEPLLFYVKESLTQVEHQIWLLRNVFWWYLLPFVISIMAFFLHVAWQTSSVGWQSGLVAGFVGLLLFVLVAGFSGLFLFVIYGWVYRLNQRAVRDQLEPRRQDLLKLVASLEDENNSEEPSDIVDLVSALGDSARGCGLSASWAENWNLIIPSWREATAIILPTLVGAYCGFRYPLPKMGPVFFQSVVAAVIPFEIALWCVWSRYRQKQKSASAELNKPASGVDLKNVADEKVRRLPNAPAILIIFLTVFLSILAILAVGAFLVDAKAGP